MVANPTRYAELNAVLADLVRSARRALGDNLCGAYLVGSFALGSADEHSDVDFLVVTHEDVTGEQLGELQAMHERLFRLGSPWAQHLDGSYAPKERLCRVDPSGQPFLYLDNGASRLVWDSH